ncbi:hypothetical protein GCM10023219_29530 [Stakelama sediminis]|uniref:histidine kinase n=1 Tax=Stakelama sediminis TaxID=463200 RepID=A0A840Z3K4_9SPHN|nr:HAMP domain-containing sensor histidine kinase [Stakelama sediminis]MBB5720266.1 hypothetical protein [Stakelama sediminis]
MKAVLRALPMRFGLRAIVPLFGLALALVLMVLGVLAFMVTENRLNAQVDHSLYKREAKLLKPMASGRAPTLDDIRARIDARETGRTISQVGHRLIDPHGTQIAGTVTQLIGSGTTAGPVEFEEMRGHHLRSGRAVTVPLSDGGRLDIVAESELVENMGKIVWPMFLAMLGVAIFGGIAVSIALSRFIAARLDTTRRTADAIMAGNLSLRVPVDPLDGMFADQARSFNHMLDRIEALMQRMRQISTDIAHDLRTPITRLRGTLEACADDHCRPERRHALTEIALQECDDILRLFSSLLRLSEIEAGRRSIAFDALYLPEFVGETVEYMQPVLEDAGLHLRCGAMTDASICADRDLLSQLLVNLLENAACHAGARAEVTVSILRPVKSEMIRIRVADSGGGIAAADREKVLQRFVRLDTSRSRAGNGLGLALVDAIARLHGGIVTLGDNRPGLIVDVHLPLAGRRMIRPAVATAPVCGGLMHA